jgi:hypothetical protein
MQSKDDNHGKTKVMKSHRKELWFNLPSRRGFVNITPDVELALRESGIKEGLALVNASLSHFRRQIRCLLGL